MNEIHKENMIQSLIEQVESCWKTIDELNSLIEQKSKNIGRKQQVYEILKMNGPLTIKDISRKLNISTKNVSSQLTYLRSDGYQIFTDNNGKKFLA
jgi:biotin operon repressor